MPPAHVLQSDPIAALIEAHGAALRRFLQLRIRDQAEAEDALQETYLRLLKYRTKDDLEFPQALIFKIADSVVRDRHRRRVSHRAHDHTQIVEADLPAVEAVQEQTVSAEQELGILSAAIAELSPKCRRVLLLSRLHQRSRQQIATELGISVQMVSKYLAQAMAHCRRKVEGEAP